MPVGCPSPHPGLSPDPDRGPEEDPEPLVTAPALQGQGRKTASKGRHRRLVWLHIKHALLQGGFPPPVKLAFGSPSACYLWWDDPRWRSIPVTRVPVFLNWF